MIANKKLRGWLSPLVYLSNNWISLIGVVVVTAAGGAWLLLLPATFRGGITHPYLGILIYMMLPGIFIGGLLLIPAGIYWKRRGQRKLGMLPDDFPPLDFQNRELRKLVM